MTRPVQLEIFRHRSRPRSSEFALHASVVALLQRAAGAGWRWMHPASGELRLPATARRLKAMGVVKGWPDLVLSHEGGRFCFIEFKARGGKLTPEQADIARHLTAAGHAFACVDTFDGAVAALQEWAVLAGPACTVAVMTDGTVSIF